ncbi:MAG: aldose epimerase [Leptolyngbyaceae cyanobacterium RU_5_1]|nr:aldose epimerase [Leptolyngbyaceae cyanobacterium RU_5_1]
MFAIALENRQYQTYVLSDDAAQSRVEIVPERGGIVTRWQVQGQDIFYLDDERFTDPTLSVRGGIPILFPICGNLPDNTYTYGGQSYTLKQHGFARDLPWDVGDQTTQDGSASLTLGLRSSDQTLAVYPFEFQLAFTYTLRGNQLILRQCYTNRSSAPMPFSAGFHPYFRVQDKSQVQVEIPSTQYQENRTKAIHSYTGSFDFEQDEIDAAFTTVSSQTASVTDRSRSLKITLTSSAAFSVLVFWTVKGKDFYCLEPWTAPRDALNTGDRLLYVKPGERMEMTVTLKAEFLG